MNRTKRAEDILTRLGTRTGMTEAGRQWTIAALDPFHDTPIDMKGIPTGESGSSCVQCVKQTITVTAPVGITTGTWDCSIVDWPWSTSVTMAAAQQSNPGGDTFFHASNFIGFPNNGTVITPIRTIITGGLTVYKGPTGAQLGTNGQGWNNTAGTTYGTNQIALPPNYTIGKHRMVAKGFEVHNTTASLYKGGSVTCWRSPVPDDTEMTTINVFNLNSDVTVAGFLYSGTAKVFDGPPETTALALLLPNSKQWDAEAGCYCVSALHSTDIPAFEGQRVTPIVEDPGYNNSIGIYGAGNIYSTIPFQQNFAGSSSIIYGNNSINVGQFDLNGAMFTGLTPQTTLTINYNIYVERFPGNDVPDLEVLACTAPERDNVALDFYTHASRNLPVGVPVNMNGLGDWFKEAISTASNFIAPALSAIPHPYAQGAGAFIKGLNGVVNGSSSSGDAQAQASPYVPVQQAGNAPPRIVEKEIVVARPRTQQYTPRQRVQRRQALALSAIQSRGKSRMRQANDNSRILNEIRRNQKFNKPMASRKGRGGVSFTV